MKYDGYQRGLASIVYRVFNKEFLSAVTMIARSETLATQNKSAVKNENMRNKVSAE